MLQYFVPGFIFICLFSFFRSAKFNETTVTIWSVVISYLCVVVAHVINGWFPALHLSQWGLLLAPSALAVIFSLLSIGVLKLECIKRILLHINHKSQYKSIWDDLIDYKDGTTVFVSMRDQNVGYCGRLFEIEENGTDSWFALSDYCKVDPNTYEILQNPSGDQGPPTLLTLNLHDISAIELYYNQGSVVAKRFFT